MAQFTKVHGDYQPVLHLDAGEYQVGALNAVSSANTVQPQGPKLDFFTVTASGSSALTGDQVNVIVETTQQLATIYIYEFTTAGPDTFAMAVYPTGAWSTTDLQANIIAELSSAGIANSVVVSATATFTG